MNDWTQVDVLQAMSDRKAKEVDEAIDALDLARSCQRGDMPERLVEQAEELAMLPLRSALKVRHWLSAKLKAIELLMRHEGMLIDKPVDESKRASAFENELREALERAKKPHAAAN